MATFYNQATLSYSGGTINSNVTTGEIIEVLSVSKTAVADSYSQGSEITYAVNIRNTGTIAYADLTVTDDLGAYTFGTTTVTPLDYVDGSVRYFVNGVLQAAPTVVTTSPLSVTGITVPAGGVATVLYTTSVNTFASPEASGTIDNTVTVSGGGITPITATETVLAAAAPSLAITKSVSPAVITENGEITYTFVIQNFGNTEADATDNVVVTDTFDPALNGITVTYNGTPWTTPANYTYNEATGEFATVLGNITVPAATYTQNPETGEWTTIPGEATITVTGTV